MNGPNEVGYVAERFGLNRLGEGQVQCPRASCNGDGKCSVCVFSDGARWRCVRCNASGNPLDYAAYATLGEVPLENSPRWKAVLARLDGRPGAAAGKPVPGAGPPSAPGHQSLPNMGHSRGEPPSGPSGPFYFTGRRTPWILIPNRRRDGKGRKP